MSNSFVGGTILAASAGAVFGTLTFLQIK